MQIFPYNALGFIVLNNLSSLIKYNFETNENLRTVESRLFQFFLSIYSFLLKKKSNLT